MAAVEEVLVCVATTVATLIKIVDLITEKLSENIFTLAFTGKWDIYFFADNAQKQSIPLNFGTEGISRRVAVNGRSLKLPTTPLQLITDPTELQRLVENEVCDNDPKVCKNAPFLTSLPECNCVYVEKLPVFGSTTRIVLTTLVQDSYSHAPRSFPRP